MASNKGLSTSLLLLLLLPLNLLFFITPNSAQTPTPPAGCPVDALKVGGCVNLLNLVNVTVGSQPPSTTTRRCCSLISGLADFEANACLCTAIRANVFGINFNLPLDVSVMLNKCGRNSTEFQCPNN